MLINSSMQHKLNQKNVITLYLDFVGLKTTPYKTENCNKNDECTCEFDRIN